jgi:hypothetical protein
MSDTVVQETTPAPQTPPAAPPEQANQPEPQAQESQQAAPEGQKPAPEAKKPSLSAEINRTRELQRRHAKEKEALIAEKKALEEQLQGLKPLEKFKNVSEQLINSPLKFLEEANITPEQRIELYNKLTSYVLNDWKDAPDADIKREIAELKKFRDTEEKRRQETRERQQQAEKEAYTERVITTFKTEFLGHLESKKDNYPVAAIDGDYSAKVALRMLEGYYKHYGYDAEPIPPEKLLEATEAYLQEQYQQELKEAEPRITKVKSAIERKASPKSNSEKSIGSPKKPAVPNNTMSANVVRSAPNGSGESSEDRRRRAIAAVEQAMKGNE